MSDNLFCPLIKQECKKDECVMWNSEACLISLYLRIGFISSAARIKVEQDLQNDELDAIFSKPANELADEIIQFAEDEHLLSDDESYLAT